jgi:eukaryotic-like serine/threonine-protein kinase
MTDFFKNAWEKLKSFGVEAGYFLSSRVFLIDFGKMMGIIGGLLFMLFWMMKCYSGHGDSVKVGNYVGKNVKEVVQSAEGMGFDIIVTDSIYKEGFPADLVLEQNPMPNAKVKDGRTIYLRITKAAGDLVTLPDLADGDAMEFYIQKLGYINVKVARIDSVLDATLAPGTIKAVIFRGQNVTNELHFKVPEGSSIELHVSKSSSDEATVPNFVESGNNMTADQFDFLLGTVGLKLGTIHADPSVTNQNVAKVYKTEPATGESLKKGSAVDIYIRE